MAMVSNQSAIDPNGTMWTWGDGTNGRLGVGYNGVYSTLPLAVTLATPATPSLTVTAGNGQNVIDGTFSNPFTISTTANTWVNLIVNQTGNLLGLSSGATQLSPIIGGYTNSSGSISFYLDAPPNGSGNVPLTATSGGSQASLSANETSSVASSSSGEPTMPTWGLLALAALLILFATRQKERMAV
jgi:hypothetical protein